MNGFNTLFMKSTDARRHLDARPSPCSATCPGRTSRCSRSSNDGKDVYITFNGPTGGDPWIAQSHDFGATWAQTKLVDSNRYFFAFDADVAPDGTVYLSQSSLLYGGGGNKGSYPTGAVEEHVFISRNARRHLGGPPRRDSPARARVRGRRLHARLLAGPQRPQPSTAAARSSWLYDGATTTRGLQTIAARRSTDAGVTWSAAVTLSSGTEQAVDPAIESTGTATSAPGTCRRRGRGNVDQWNTCYRRSTDGGATWSAAVRISDATGGAAYKTAAGYLEPYGDYGEIAITPGGPRRSPSGARAPATTARAGSGTTASPDAPGHRAHRRAAATRGRFRNLNRSSTPPHASAHASVAYS